MNKFPPDPEKFVSVVEQYDYDIEDLYYEAVEQFQREILQHRTYDPAKIEEVVWNTFLKQWGEMQRNVPEVSDLTAGLRYTIPQCEKVGLLNCKLREAKLNDAETQKIIKKIYEKFNSDDVFKIGPTGASKLLHLVNPDLFMMWESDIRGWLEDVAWFKKQGSWDAEMYLQFLQQMQKWAKSLHQKPRVKKLIDKQKKPLAKLLDQYNLQMAKNKESMPRDGDLEGGIEKLARKTLDTLLLTQTIISNITPKYQSVAWDLLSEVKLRCDNIFFDFPSEDAWKRGNRWLTVKVRNPVGRKEKLFHISARKIYPLEIGDVYDSRDDSKTSYKIGKNCQTCYLYEDVKEKILEKIERAYGDLTKDESS